VIYIYIYIYVCEYKNSNHTDNGCLPFNNTNRHKCHSVFLGVKQITKTGRKRVGDRTGWRVQSCQFRVVISRHTQRVEEITHTGKNRVHMCSIHGSFGRAVMKSSPDSWTSLREMKVSHVVRIMYHILKQRKNFWDTYASLYQFYI